MRLIPEAVRQLDELLRGRRTGPAELAGGRIDLPLRPFIIMAVILGASYGFFMGWFSFSTRGWAGLLQMLATTVKLPALFLLTLAVTFPSLYVFNALVGARLDFAGTLRLLVAAIVVNLAVGASFGPILGFFTVSTDNYSFMVLLNVLLLAIAGLVGLAFLLQTLRRLGATPGLPHHEPGMELPPPLKPPGPLDGLSGLLAEDSPRAAKTIFRIWVIIYALVGAQMGWVLRPFIGNPDAPIELFRHREGNVFQSIFHHLLKLIGVPS